MKTLSLLRVASLTSLAALCLSGCADPEKVDDTDVSTTADGCDTSVDSDGDGLDDCLELEELGTDPELADSDGDGSSDGDELDCASDPLDGDEACYACGWVRGDPGTLSSDGDDVGDTIENLEMVDQCEEMVDLWDFAGEYHVLFLTAAW